MPSDPNRTAKKSTDNRTFYIRPASNVVVVVILHLMTDINFMSLFSFVLFFFCGISYHKENDQITVSVSNEFFKMKIFVRYIFFIKNFYTSEMLYSCTFLIKTTTFIYFHCMQFFLIQVLLKSGLVQNALVTFFLAINL